MHASADANQDAGAWFVEADPVGVTAPARKPSRVRSHAERENSASVVVVSSLFLVLIATALMVGGQAAIDPLLQSAMAEREAKGVGEVFYAMPDGIFCRHMSYENATGEVAEGALERCSDDIARQRGRVVRNFAWGANSH